MYAKYIVLKLYLNLTSNAEGREMSQDGKNVFKLGKTKNWVHGDPSSFGIFAA